MGGANSAAAIASCTLQTCVAVPSDKSWHGFLHIRQEPESLPMYCTRSMARSAPPGCSCLLIGGSQSAFTRSYSERLSVSFVVSFPLDVGVPIYSTGGLERRASFEGCTGVASSA